MIYLEIGIAQVVPIIEHIPLHIILGHAYGMEKLDSGRHRGIEILLMQASKLLLQKIGAPWADPMRMCKDQHAGAHRIMGKSLQLTGQEYASPPRRRSQLQSASLSAWE